MSDNAALSNNAKLGAAASAALAIATAVVLFGPVMTGECADMNAACDGIVCVLRNFIGAVVSNGGRVSSVWFVFSFYVPVALRMLLEMHPVGAAAIMQMGQFLGISVAFPLFFVPLHGLGKGRRTHDGARATAAGALGGVTLILASVMLVMLSGGAQWAADLFNFWIIVPGCVLAWLLLGENVIDTSDFGIKEAWLVSGGLGTFPWVLSVLGFIVEGGIDTGDCLVNFFVIDGIVLFISLLVHLYLCGVDNPAKLAKTAGLTLILGPGLAFGFAFNELEDAGAKIA